MAFRKFERNSKQKLPLTCKTHGAALTTSNYVQWNQTAHVKKTLSLDVWSRHLPKNVPLFGYDMVEMWFLWAPHTSWCIQVSRNAPHTSGENTGCYKSQLRADMQAWAPSSNAHTYIRAIFCCILSTGRFFYTSNVAPNKVEMEMYIQHTRETHIKTETCMITAPKRDQIHK